MEQQYFKKKEIELKQNEIANILSEEKLLIEKFRLKKENERKKKPQTVRE